MENSRKTANSWSSNGFAEEKMENGKKDLTMLIHSRSAKEKRERLKVNFKLEKVAEIKTDSLTGKTKRKR